MTENFNNVNHLVLNFYPDGYSIAVKLNEFPVFTSETILETAKISYEETSLLDYIENEELPPLLVEMIDGSPKLSQYKIWHNGCLILEVRDKIGVDTDDRRKDCPGLNNKLKNHSADTYRGQICSSPRLDSHWNNDHRSRTNNDDNYTETSETMKPKKNYFILLKPTNLSMLNDVLSLTESNSWTTQDRLQLESQIVLHNSPPLFLEPDSTKLPQDSTSNSIGTRTCNALTRNNKRLPHKKLSSLHKFNSNANHNNKKTLFQTSPEDLPPELNLQQFLAAKRAMRKTFNAAHLAKFHRHKRHATNK